MMDRGIWKTTWKKILTFRVPYVSLLLLGDAGDSDLDLTEILGHLCARVHRTCAPDGLQRLLYDGDLGLL